MTAKRKSPLWILLDSHNKTRGFSNRKALMTYARAHYPTFTLVAQPEPRTYYIYNHLKGS